MRVYFCIIYNSRMMSYISMKKMGIIVLNSIFGTYKLLKQITNRVFNPKKNGG